jgi:hypothetical protein
MPLVRCPGCRTSAYIRPGARECPHCGETLEPPPRASSDVPGHGTRAAGERGDLRKMDDAVPQDLSEG